MKRLVSLFIIFSVFLIQAGYTNAAEVELFGISNHSENSGMTTTGARNDELGSTLYRVDYRTGSAIPVGPVGYHDCRGLDFHPLTGQLYATCLGESHNPVLLDINPNTGHGTKITELQFQNDDFGSIRDISFRDDGTLFAYVGAKAESFLAILNPETGVIENLGPVGLLGEGNGIAFNALLYNAQTDLLPTLNVLDQTNGAATFLTNLTVPLPPNGHQIIPSMDKDTDNGIFYGVLDNETAVYTFYLVTIDVDSGLVTLIGETVDGLDSIAVRNPRITNVPTLSEYGMIALAIVFLASALLVLKRRKLSSSS